MSKVPIIITGFMGSGKTTVAQALARILDCPSIDLDQLITERAGRTPKEIIEQDGQSGFREIETRLLRQVLGQGSARVIALGGGAWTMQTNRDLIAEHNGFAIWLDAPFALCWQRITTAGQKRPLAGSEEQARKLYEERRPVYELATLRVTVAGREVYESALAIARRLAGDGITDGPLHLDGPGNQRRSITPRSPAR
jgi:shikimate kinase